MQGFVHRRLLLFRQCHERSNEVLVKRSEVTFWGLIVLVHIPDVSCQKFILNLVGLVQKYENQVESRK